jgi:hypothetical protein
MVHYANTFTPTPEHCFRIAQAEGTGLVPLPPSLVDGVRFSDHPGLERELARRG